MYKFPYYTEEDPQKVIDFMKANPFALLTGNGHPYPVATQLPVEVGVGENGKLILSGHMMKKTDHQLAFEKDPHVLVLFTGPHTYVSASWYTTPVMGSTWDYMTVHARGQLRFTNEAGTRSAVRAVTDRFEGKETASAFDQLPEEYITRMVKAITGFHIEVDSLENVFKLSQNRNRASQLNIIEQLQKRGDDHSRMIAEEIGTRLNPAEENT